MASKDLVVPALGESISEAVIGRWLKKVGDATAADEPVVDLETDKITVQLPAPAAGVLAEQRYQEGATVKVGEVIGSITEGAVGAKPPPPPGNGRGAAAAPTAPQPPSAAPTPPTPAPTPPAAAPTPPTPVPTPPTPPTPPPSAPTPALSPSRRRALREQGGPVAIPTPAPAAPAPPAPAPVEPAVPSAREEVVPMTPLRKRIAERLVQAQHTAACLTTFNEVDMSAVLDLRTRHQEAFVAKHGVKLGFMSFFTKASVAALREFPGLNAEIRGNDILYKKHYDIGIAVGSGRGLVVPVVRNADRLSFAEIEKEIARLSAKAKDNKLTLDDLAGGTFTITNGGIYGSMLSTPLLNYPQTGILGMHNIVKRPVAVGDEIQLRPVMYVALTYDHRIVDGREAVQFLVAIKQRIESPDRLLFEI